MLSHLLFLLTFLFGTFKYIGRNDTFNKILIFNFGTKCLMIGAIWIYSKNDWQFLFHSSPKSIEIFLSEIKLPLIILSKEKMLVRYRLAFPLSFYFLISFSTLIIFLKLAWSFTHCWIYSLYDLIYKCKDIL